MNAPMTRILTLLLAVILAVPAIAHTYEAPDCHSFSVEGECGVGAVDTADLLKNRDQKGTGGEAQKHCLTHCAALASVFEFDCLNLADIPLPEPHVAVLLHRMERIPRPPDVA